MAGTHSNLDSDIAASSGAGLVDDVAMSRSAAATAAMAQQAIGLLDLTRLEDEDDDEAVDAFCRQALTPLGTVAAICIYPRFVALAKRTLANAPVVVATVVNFPDGAADVDAAVSQTRAAIDAGADEIDVVFPHQAYRSGARGIGRALVTECREVCGVGVRLKVIMETGLLETDGGFGALADMAGDALSCGADFLKTSTGKRGPGASLQAAAILLSAIRDATGRLGPAGLKVSGGIRTADEAARYMVLAERMMEPGYLSPRTFRIGASTLRGDLLRRAGVAPRDGAP